MQSDDDDVPPDMRLRLRTLQLAFETEALRPGITAARVLRTAHDYAMFVSGDDIAENRETRQ
jgi:hypothetical protein